MRPRDAERDGEAQSGPRRLSGEEWLEHPGHNLRRNAFAGILHVNAKPAAAFRHHPQRHGTAGRGGFHRVHHQVHQGLLHLARVDFRRTFYQRDEIERLKKEPVSEEELEGVKARAKMQFIDSIDSNMGLAMQLAFYQNLEGDWRDMFKTLDRIDAVSADDIMRVAQKTFIKSNRTVGMIETTPAPAAK